MDKGLEFWVGLTGGIATGKSTASDYLIKHGFVVIDADKIVSKLLSDSEVIEQISSKISLSVVRSDGSLDRKKLGEIVFNDKESLTVLNSIMHPRVRQITRARKKSSFDQGHRVVFNDVPLLFENNLEQDYSQTVLIYCNESDQLERLMRRNGFTKEEALARITSQMDIELKKEKADFVISNTSTLDELYEQLDSYILELKKMS